MPIKPRKNLGGVWKRPWLREPWRNSNTAKPNKECSKKKSNISEKD